MVGKPEAGGSVPLKRQPEPRRLGIPPRLAAKDSDRARLGVGNFGSSPGAFEGVGKGLGCTHQAMGELEGCRGVW